MLNKNEIIFMRISCSILKDVFEKIKPLCVPGMSTLKISKEIEKIIRSHNAIPAFLGYRGFPESSCISVNDTLVHGIPREEILLQDGDIVSVDVGANYNGYFSDACRTFEVGNCSEKAKKIIKVAEECFFKALEFVKPGVSLKKISETIEIHAKNSGFSLPHEFGGHGIGKRMHEDPFIPNLLNDAKDIILREGMILAIEPMISEGSPEVKFLDDGWTVKMKDGKLSSHYENTVLVTKDGYEILTK